MVASFTIRALLKRTNARETQSERNVRLNCLSPTLSAASNVRRITMTTRINFRLFAYLAIFALVSDVAAGELSGLLRAASSHPQVRSAISTSQAAQAQLDAAGARYLGSAALSTAWHQYEGPRIVGVYTPGVSGVPLSAEGISQTGLTYSVPVDVFGAIAANRERAKNDLAAAELFARQQVLLKLHQTTSAYVSLQALLKQREALSSYRQRVTATHQRIVAEVQLGRTAGVEARYAESELARLAADEAVLEGALAQTQADLAEASGEQGFLPTNGDIRVPALDDTVTVAMLPAQIAQARSEAAVAQAEEARRALYPALSIDANYFRNAGNAGGHRDTWTIGVAVSLPLSVSQHGQARAQRLNATSASEQSEAATRDSERQLVSLRASYNAANADARALATEEAYRAEVAAVQREMQRLGSQTLENFVRHERDLLDARYRLAQAKARATVSWSAIQVLAGLPTEIYIDRVDAK